MSPGGMFPPRGYPDALRGRPPGGPSGDALRGRPPGMPSGAALRPGASVPPRTETVTLRRGGEDGPGLLVSTDGRRLGASARRRDVQGWSARALAAAVPPLRGCRPLCRDEACRGPGSPRGPAAPAGDTDWRQGREPVLGCRPPPHPEAAGCRPPPHPGAARLLLHVLWAGGSGRGGGRGAGLRRRGSAALGGGDRACDPLGRSGDDDGD